MPPKQKEVKKGPTYKPATPFKDMVPSTIKQQPRQPRLLKIPQIQATNTDKNIIGGNQNQVIFEQWPSQQVVKTHDFGIASDVKFQDKLHNSIKDFINAQTNTKDKMINWKYIHQLQNMRPQESDEQNKSDEQQNQQIKSQTNLQVKKDKQQTKQNQNNKQTVVIQTYLRDETQQQMQKRKKEEAEKAQKAAKDKKKGKKQQPKEEGPLKVSDVKMSNVIVKKYMCPSGIWIGSQLQIVKIRDLKDVYTNEPVWKKIYPQENGVPQITKSGKYWVKLYYMGKAVKVEIDDRVPVDYNTRQLFAVSEKSNQKWTLIITKAVLKLISLTNPKTAIIGSGMVINALTGFITQNLNIRTFSDWAKLQKFLDFKHYSGKDIIVNCFSFDGKRQAPSNFIRSKQQMKNIITLDNSTFRKKGKRRNSALNLMSKGLEDEDYEEQKIEEHYVESNVFPGYAYSLGDYFQNDDFNMIYSKQKGYKQQKLKLQYNNMSKIVLNNKTREEKLQHRRKKKQIKQKLQIQQKKRLDLINKPIAHYHFVKLLADIIINCEYSHKQILLAKKCVLNDLPYPPNYQIPNEEKDKQKQQSKLGSTTAIKFKEEADVNPSLQDFSKLEDHKTLQNRAQDGIWIKDQDLLKIFDQLQIFYNPNKFQHKSIETVANKTPKQFTTDENKQILVIQKQGNPHIQNTQNQVNELAKINMLFGFAFEESKWDTLCDPYCMLQKFDFQSYRTASTVTTLSKPLGSAYLTLNNNNSVFRIYTLSKGKYAYWISCDNKFKLLSMADYLTQFQAYTTKSFTIQYPPIQKNTFLSIARIKVKNDNDEVNTLFFKLKNCPKEIQKYLSIKIVQVPQGSPYTTEEYEGIVTMKLESLHLVYEYSRAELHPRKSYYIILQSYPVESISEGTIELSVLSKFNTGLILDQTEQIQPYKVVQKYNPNKYANILKERLFCNNNINATLVLKLFEGQQGQPITTDKKASKKGGKEEATFQIIQKQMHEKRLIHVKILKNGNLIYYNKDYNEVIIPNIQFEKTSEQVNYYLQASFDLRQWPAASSSNQLTNKIYWSVQVTGEDAVAFVKDTLQQQKQKQTRKSWEDKQPGRAEKAKKARQKFLLQLKQQKGEHLTEEQLQIINAPKLTKKKMLEEQKKNEQNKKGGKGAKKDDKKVGKDKKQQIIQEKHQEKPLPKSNDNYMNELKQFLTNLQSFKVIKVHLNQKEQPKIRTDEQQNSIKEAALMAKQNRTAQISRNIELREVMKIKQKDKKDKLTILLEDSRQGFNSHWKQYIKWRMEDQDKDKVKQEKEKALIQVIKQQKATISQADLTKLINEYKSVQSHNARLVQVGQMIRKNIKISNMTEKINNALEGWEVEILKAIGEEIKNQKIEGINQQSMEKMHTMLEQSAKNPSIVAQKQAQLKKMKKGGKK